MNWTGGNLQRHSTTTVSTKDRQKQHFAKIRQNQCHQVRITHPIKFSFSRLDAEDCRLSPYPSLTITESHNASNCPDQSFSSNLRLSPTKLQSKRRRHICGTEALLGPSIKRENEGISNINLHSRIPGFNSEIKLTACKSADKTLSGRQNALSEPVSKKQKILDMPDWVGIGMSKPLPMNYSSPAISNNGDYDFFNDMGQYTPNDHSKAFILEKDLDQKVVSNRLMKNQTPISDCNELLTKIDSNFMQVRDNKNSTASPKDLPETSDYALMEKKISQGRFLSFPIFSIIRGQPQDYHQISNKKFEPCFLEKSQANKSGSRLSFYFSPIRNEDNYSTVNIDSVPSTKKGLDKKSSQAIPREASTKPDVFFASSTVCLQHPIPISSKVSCLLKAKSTNEVRDNEIASLDFESTQTNFLDKKSTNLSSNLNLKLYDHQKFLDFKKISIQYFSQNRDFRFSSVFQSETSLDSSSSISPSETEFTPISELEAPCNRMTKKVRLKGMQTYQKSNKSSSTCHGNLKANRTDLEQVWKDFVFGACLDESINSKIGFR